MERFQNLLKAFAGLLFAFSFMTPPAALSLPYPHGELVCWDRVELAGGGVCFDIGLVDAATDVAWAVCGNNGLYRSTWNGSSWGTWTEHLTGRYVTGVDAILSNGVEHVMGASGNWGLWYKNGSAAWARPNPAYYPQSQNNDWTSVAIHDAAFVANYNQTYPTYPEQQYYCILNGEVGSNLAGLYKWQTDPAGFVRLDADTEGHTYDHFYRDMKNPNVLYITSPHGIYKLSGPYGNPKFEKLPEWTRLQDLPIARPPKSLPAISNKR